MKCKICKRDHKEIVKDIDRIIEKINREIQRLEQLKQEKIKVLGYDW